MKAARRLLGSAKRFIFLGSGIPVAIFPRHSHEARDIVGRNRLRFAGIRPPYLEKESAELRGRDDERDERLVGRRILPSMRLAAWNVYILSGLGREPFIAIGSLPDASDLAGDDVEILDIGVAVQRNSKPGRNDTPQDAEILAHVLWRCQELYRGPK